MSKSNDRLAKENFTLRKHNSYLRAALEIRTQERDAARNALTSHNLQEAMKKWEAYKSEATGANRKSFKRIG